MSLSKLTDNKLVVALIVPLILLIVTWASGMSELPSTVKQHETRITNQEAETRALREGGIRNEEQLRYLVKLVEGLAESDRKRNERGR